MSGHDSLAVRLGELMRLFLRLGVTAFGGPAAHIAMMHDEVVRRRGWMDDQRFLDMTGATNLIPGPNSTEMAMHLGHERAGWRGLLTAGVCFILPASVIVLIFAWGYVRYGDTPTGEALLYGVKPVIIAIIGAALIRLGRVAVTGWLLGVVGLVAVALYVAGVNELLILVGGALLVLVVRAPRSEGMGMLMMTPMAVQGVVWSRVLAQSSGGSVDLTQLFSIFLKVGAVLYGSGYVLLAFLQGDLVDRLGWLTSMQLLDAIAVGQFTPGPVFTTATFVGFVLGGLPGAVAATVGIFLPSFLLVGALGLLLPRIRDRSWTAALLDGVNVAAMGLMAGVLFEIGGDALVDPITIGLAAISGLLLWKTTLNTAWLVLGGAAVGLAVSVL